MSTAVPAKQRVHRILKGSPCYLPPVLRLGRPFPKGVTLSPEEEFLGAIWGSRLESLLTDRGAFLRSKSGWQFVPYAEVEEVCFPEKTAPDGLLTLRTSVGSFGLLRRRPELWTAGTYFMRCAIDAKAG